MTTNDWPQHPKHGQVCAANGERDEVLAEYNALRNEIAMSIQLRSRIQLAAIVALGVFLGFGLEDVIAPTVVLCYPILTFFLSVEYAQRDLRVAEIGDYLCYYTASRCPNIWWERFFRQYYERAKEERWFYRWRWLGTVGTFIGASIASVVIILGTKVTVIRWFDWVLVGVDCVCVLAMCCVLRARRDRLRSP